MAETAESQDGGIEAVLSHVSSLPSPTRVYEQVSSMLLSPRTSAKDIADVVSADQAITARLLKLVNSPFYGFSEQITTISRAITIIGFEALRNLILASSLTDLFAARHKGGGIFNVELLWVHSLATGVAARTIARKIGHGGEAEEYLVAGLMHDVGKAVLLQYFGKHVDAILQEVKTRDCLFIEGEQRVLNSDHTVIGSALAEQWRLPAILRNTIAKHHAPMEADDQVRAGAVHLADILARALLFGSGGDRSMPSLDEEAYKLLRLDDQKLHEIMREVYRGLAADPLAFLA